MIGSEVYHKTYGSGIIEEASSNYIIVQFAASRKKFSYPSAFEQYLSTNDANLNMQVHNDIERYKREKTSKVSTANTITKSKSATKDKINSHVYLCTFNPLKYPWANLSECARQTKHGIPYERQWTFVNSHVEAGDRIFLIRLGSEPRGVIASGYATSSQFNDDNRIGSFVLPQKCITISFDTILDCETEKILPYETLTEEMPEQCWSPQSSGIEIKSYYVEKLENVWKRTILNVEEDIK